MAVETIKSELLTLLSIPSEGLLRHSSLSLPSGFERNVVEPPPSKFNAVSHPILSIISASSWKERPYEIGALRPSLTSVTTFPSGLIPITVLGLTPVP